jgi:hypothetical protein
MLNIKVVGNDQEDGREGKCLGITLFKTDCRY